MMKYGRLVILFFLGLCLGYFLGDFGVLQKNEINLGSDLEAIVAGADPSDRGDSSTISDWDSISTQFQENPNIKNQYLLWLAVSAMSDSALKKEFASSLEKYAKEKSDYHNIIIRYLIQVLAERAPAEAMEIIVAMNDESIASNMIYYLYAHWAKNDYTGALKTLKFIKKEHLYKRAQYSVVNVMAKEYPHKALELVIKHKNSRYTSSLLHTVFSHWATIDSDAAIVALDKIKNRHYYSSALRAMVDVLAEIDPFNAFTILESRGGLESRWSYRNVFLAWANRDENEARKAIGNISNVEHRKLAWKGYYEALLASDPGNAIREINAITDKFRRGQMLLEIMPDVFKGDINIAFSLLDEIEDRTLRSKILEQSLYQAAQKDPAKVFDWVMKNTSGATQDKAIGHVIDNVIQRDLQQARQMVEKLPYGGAYRSAFSKLANAWGKRDPDSALDWLRAQADGIDKLNAISDVYGFIIEADADAALLLLEKMDQGAEYDDLLNGIIQHRARNSDPDIAMEWADGFEDEETRAKAYDVIISNWSKNDPVAAAKYFVSINYQGIEGYASSITSSWARWDLDGASNWAIGIPEGEGRESAVKTIAQEWIKHDPMKASEWISKIATGSIQDSAIEVLVYGIITEDPVSAFEWASSMSQSSKRKTLVQSVLYEWMEMDPVAARQAVLTGSFSAKEIGYYLQNLEE